MSQKGVLAPQTKMMMTKNPHEEVPKAKNNSHRRRLVFSGIVNWF